VARSSTAAAKTPSKKEMPHRTRSASAAKANTGTQTVQGFVPLGEVAGLLLLVLAGPFLFLSLVAPESLGLIGPPLRWALSEALGAAAFLLPVFLMLLGAELFSPVLKIPLISYGLGLLILLLCLDITAYLLAPPGARAFFVEEMGIWKYLLSLKGGLLGTTLGGFLVNLAGTTGASLLVGTAVLLDLSWVTGLSLRKFLLILLYPVRILVRALIRILARRTASRTGVKSVTRSDSVGVKKENGLGPEALQNMEEECPGSAQDESPFDEEILFEAEDDEVSDEDALENEAPVEERAKACEGEERSSTYDEMHGEEGAHADGLIPGQTGRTIEGEAREVSLVPDYPVPAEAAKAPEPSSATEEMPRAMPMPVLRETPSESIIPSTPGASGTLITTPGGETFEQLELFPMVQPEAPKEKPRAPATFRYKLPPLTLLRDYGEVKVKELADYSDVIVETLRSFGVETRILRVVHGPAVTRYELRPDRGVKVSRITNLANDLALVLKTPKVNLLVPIPGEQAIGVEVPNRSIEMVPFKRILETSEYRKGSRFSLAIGKDISGRNIVEDLTKMPHLLIAGATGSGKTVCVNSIIASLLYKATPHDMQVIMIDPKQVELSLYEGIPHLVRLEGVNQMGNTRIRWTPGMNIVTSAELATEVLKAVTAIMDQRFEVFKDHRARNILEYNAKAKEPLARLIVVIDELADLMMVSSNAVEASICRLTQLGRAAGIHIIVATQRPSVDVITGLIKANMPFRIAFAVSSMVDSRTIIDKGGAEKLLGKGDMLYMPTGQEPQRVQGAYLETEEIERIVEFWAKQPPPQSQIVLDFQSKQAIEDIQEDDEDELITACINVIKTTGQASASLFQRKLSIGYARAGRLIDLLEKRGVVGPADGAKPRKILIPVNAPQQDA
jgi:S-DNA-T family DNA segregation ATPase FtsK/SpoIIIE